MECIICGKPSQGLFEGEPSCYSKDCMDTMEEVMEEYDEKTPSKRN